MEKLAKITEEQFDIAVAFDGTWHHQGAPMTRLPLVRLFASVLQRDAQGVFWLITPVERGRIDVADAPFVAVSFRVEGLGTPAQTLFLTDNIGRECIVDAQHPLVLRIPQTMGGPFVPYQHLGGGLEARLATSVYYELVDIALAQHEAQQSASVSEHLRILSAGVLHPLGVLS